MPAERVVTYEEFKQHNERHNLWVLLHGKGTLSKAVSLLSRTKYGRMYIHLGYLYTFLLSFLAPDAD